MKKYSLVTQELLDAYVSIMQIVLGFVGLINRNSLISVILAFLALVLFIFVLIFRIKKKFDTWDETAKEHYATARRITIKVMNITSSLIIITFLMLRLTISIGALHIMIVSGIFSLLPSIIFIILEKREL